ncbi:Hint domain-containing protein [Acetobacter senegalensis]|uniref:Hint domain-containing protein n=1 Tax=Acetobacter senegalensis TaxID=446692 RepID=UPI0026514FB2|nr:Hint domain-containing protein [Acetobacter senegalensis]MDN7349963.1 Hint domain-containing protein [Acetobacter senegalensis]
MAFLPKRPEEGDCLKGAFKQEPHHTSQGAEQGDNRLSVPEASLLEGTCLHTPAGKAKVETLSPGHAVLGYADGQETPHQVSQVRVAYGMTLPGLPDDEAGYPIRILKDAIADGVPARDVVLTPDHCLFFEDKFVPLCLLVNRLSIFYDRTFTAYKAYPVQTDPHAVLIAENLLIASALPPCPEDSHWHTRTHMPVVTDRIVVEGLYHRLKSRAEVGGLESPFYLPEVTDDHDLQLVTENGQFIRKAMEKDNVAVFMLPPDVHEVHLSSRASRPVDVIGPYVQDKRYLGVHVGDITLVDSRKRKKVMTHIKEDLLGWHPPEEDGGRWTNGHAHLPIRRDAKRGPGMLGVQILTTIPYLVTDYHGPRRHRHR